MARCPRLAVEQDADQRHRGPARPRRPRRGRRGATGRSGFWSRRGAPDHSRRPGHWSRDGDRWGLPVRKRDPAMLFAGVSLNPSTSDLPGSAALQSIAERHRFMGADRCAGGPAAGRGAVGGRQSHAEHASFVAGSPRGTDLAGGGDTHRRGADADQLLLQRRSQRPLVSHFLCRFLAESCVNSPRRSRRSTTCSTPSRAGYSGASSGSSPRPAHVLTSASDPSTVSRASQSEFNALLVMAPALLMIGLLGRRRCRPFATARRRRCGGSIWASRRPASPAIVLARPIASLVLDGGQPDVVECGERRVAQHEDVAQSSQHAHADDARLRALHARAAPWSSGRCCCGASSIVRAVVLTLAAGARAGRGAPVDVSRPLRRLGLASRRDVPRRRGEQVRHRRDAWCWVSKNCRARRRPR